MNEYFRILTQYLHVFAAILWLGGGFYTLIVQVPGLLAAPPQARGPVLQQIAPRQIFYILRVAELTLVTGVGNLLLSGRARQLEEPFGSRWAMVMVVGIVLAVVLYGLVRGMTKPLVERLLRVAPQAAGGDQAAAQQVPVLRERIRRLGIIQISIGAVILFAMVMARFS